MTKAKAPDINEFKTVPVEWKAEVGDPGSLQGYASVFDAVDNDEDVVMQGAFAKTIRERIPKGIVPLIDTHGLANGFPPIPTSRDVIGTVVAAKEDQTGLLIKAKLSSTPEAQAVRTKVLEGHIGYMSIGYVPTRFHFETRSVDGQKVLVRVLDEVKLGEVSVVPLPAQELAAITAVKSATTALDQDDWTYEGASSFVAAVDRLRRVFATKADGLDSWDAQVSLPEPLQDSTDVDEPPAKRPHRWLLARAAETPWLMRPSALAAAIELLSIRADGGTVSMDDDPDEPDGTVDVPPGRAGSVQILSVFGSIVPKASQMPNLSGGGGTSLAGLRKSLRAALDDDAVEAIVLDVDSAGGVSLGVKETADEIRAARGSKPIVAVATGQAASAAYWLASQADELWVTPSGMVGSIGAWIAHKDMSGALEQEGVDVTLISAGKYKVEGNPFEPLSEEAREALQREVDDVYAEFVDGVAAARGTSAKVVREGYGQGRMLNARRALAAGMVDRVGTLEDAVKKLGGDASALKSRRPYEYPTPTELRAREIKGGSGSATDDTPWDEAAVMGGEHDAAYYRAVSGIEHTKGEPDQSQHWALPHHKRPGGPANASAIGNARSRFNQTQDLKNREAARRHIYETHRLPSETKVDGTLDVREWKRRSNALLEGRDPDVMADPARVVAASTRIDILEREIANVEQKLTAKAAVAALVAKGDRLTSEDLKNLADRMDGDGARRL